MKILITGVNGLVGKNLHDELIKTDYHVDGCGRSEKSESNYHRLDLTNYSSTYDHLKTQKYNWIVHCAASTSPKDCSLTYSNNIAASLNLAQSIRKLKYTNIIHISGIAVVGSVINSPVTESHPIDPQTLYHLSKYHSEQIFENVTKDFVRTVNIRIPSPIGLYMQPISAFPKFINQASHHQHIRVNRNSCIKQNFLDIRDLARFVLCIINQRGPSGLYNLGNDQPYSYFEVAKMIIERLKSKSKLTTDYPSTDDGPGSIWDISTSKAQKDYGYTSKFKLAQSIDWIISNA